MLKERARRGLGGPGMPGMAHRLKLVARDEWECMLCSCETCTQQVLKKIRLAADSCMAVARAHVHRRYGNVLTVQALF